MYNTICDPASLCEWLNDIFYQKDIDIDKLCDLFTEAYFNYPCAVLYGHEVSNLANYFDEEDSDDLYYYPLFKLMLECAKKISFYFLNFI